MIEEPAEHPQPGTDRDGRRGRRDRGIGERVVLRGDEAHDPECDKGHRGRLEPASRQEPQAGADDERDPDDEQLEGELVVRAEERNHDVLGAGRLEVDDDLSDGGNERGRTGQEPGQELRDAEGQRGRGDACERGPTITQA